MVAAPNGLQFSSCAIYFYKRFYEIAGKHEVEPIITSVPRRIHQEEKAHPYAVADDPTENQEERHMYNCTDSDYFVKLIISEKNLTGKRGNSCFS